MKSTPESFIAVPDSSFERRDQVADRIIHLCFQKLENTASPTNDTPERKPLLTAHSHNVNTDDRDDVLGDVLALETQYRIRNTKIIVSQQFVDQFKEEVLLTSENLLSQHAPKTFSA